MSVRQGDVRLVLLGNIGCGKSSSADTILNQMSPRSLSTSRSCQLREGRSEGHAVTLVETPRWYWVRGEMEDGVRKETERAMTLLAPGPHAVLLLVPVGQFTEVEARVPGELEDLFGEDVLDHTLVLLTCGDYLMGKTPEQYLQEEQQGLSEVIRQCAGYHVFNNRRRHDREQVRELLEKVDDIVRKKGIYHIKTEQEKKLEQQVKQRKKELLERFRAEKEEKEKAIASSLQSTETVHRRDEYMDILRNKDERHVEEAVRVRQVSKGLQSVAASEGRSETRSDRKVERTPSFKLNADGALLTKIADATSNPKRVSTYHHRLSSSEGSSPEASPTSSPRSNVLSPSPPTFASSPSVVFSSSSSSSPSYNPSPSSSSEDIRLVMLGRSGAGKSAAGNAILGRQEFESRPESLTSITQRCEKKKAVVGNKRVAVVDTPDWFNTEQTPDEVRAQVSSCVALASPGPHAFLLCVPLDQPAKTELQALQALQEVFGPDSVQKHTIILFTYTDLLRKSGKAGSDSVESYIADHRGDLLKLVEKCGDRFHVMEMEGGRREKNVAELMEKVDQTMKEAGMEFYTCPAFQEAEDRVRHRQRELAKEKMQLKQAGEEVDNGGTPLRHSYKRVAQEEELIEEMEEMRDEAEKIVGATNIESLPPITLSNISPSLLQSFLDKMRSSTKMLPRLVSDGSTWVGEGAKTVKNSQMLASLGRAAQNSQKMVADSSVWGKVGATAGNVSKAVGDRVPKVVVDGSAWVGSGAKAVASSPVWGKVGSGAKKVADNSVRVGAGIGAGAKNIAQSPMWGKVGSGAKSGAKLMAESSVKVGAGVAAGAKKVAQSPVWGKVGSGAKAGAKMVAESSVWQKIGNNAKKVPKVVVLGAVLGLVLGVFLGGTVGGAIGVAAGSAAAEVGRRKLNNKRTKTGDAVRNVELTLNNRTDGVERQWEKALKTQ
ncbi:uncharacterized protein LOC114467358 [Gouania willdenowi]|uniref:Uncharacterized LOC114467358 n=1 Tax=Gouania willdenowi TaxID=441366 RepID=A0A8C5EHB0_GOUWI|nr:uncharacterized protein LOC114467358 [Gouania willdenowi]